MNLMLQQSNSKDPNLSTSTTPGSKDSKDINSQNNNSTILSGFLGNNKKSNEKINELQLQIKELKSLEKLRPQLLELQQQLTNLQTKYNEQQSYYHNEIQLLTEHNEQLSNGVVVFKKELDEKILEISQNAIIIKQLNEKVKYLESESRQLLIDLDDAKYEIEQIRQSSADPLLIDELQKKIEQLEGKIIIIHVNVNILVVNFIK